MTRRSIRMLVAGGVLAAGLILALCMAYERELARAYHVVRLFEPPVIEQNFRSMDAMFDIARVAHGAATHRFAVARRDLPATYEYDGAVKEVDAFLHDTWTTGLIVLHDGQIAHERYFRGNTAASKAIAWSVSKSFVSALVGIALEEGSIRSVDNTVGEYVPALRGTAYGDVTIKDVLRMASGVRFSEDYGAFFSDINRLGRAIALNAPIDELVASLQRERAPGTVHHYISADTQVLGMVLRAATGKTLAAYLESRIWRRLGMESDAYWLVDRDGVELAFGGFNAVLRDYARFGQLYLDEGRWGERQVVPRAWVLASIAPSELALAPERPSSAWARGYGYQWWIPRGTEGDYMAVGHSNQFIYVHPGKRIVIAKTSAYPRYTVDGNDKERETIAVFRAIAKRASATVRQR